VYEGYGSPLMEAMASGAPAVCGPALAETAGGATRIVNVESADELAGAIREILASPEETQRLRRLGRERASQFSYARTARATWDAYRDLVGEAGLS